jgi:hypothetical protein
LDRPDWPPVIDALDELLAEGAQELQLGGMDQVLLVAEAPVDRADGDSRDFIDPGRGQILEAFAYDPEGSLEDSVFGHPAAVL